MELTTKNEPTLKSLPNKVKILIISYLILAMALVLTFLIVFFDQKPYLKQEVDKGRSVLVKVTDDEIIVGKVLNQKVDKKLLVKNEKPQGMKLYAKQRIDPILLRAKPIEDKNQNRPKIALIAIDLGLNKSSLLEVLEINNKITLGFTPYGNDIGGWVDQAVQKGYEVLMNLPMQPIDYPVNDPGPYALLHNLSIKENLSKVDWVLSRANKIIGVYSNSGETFTNSKANILPVFELIKKYNLTFVYGDNINNQALENLSENLKIDYIDVNLTIDDELSETEAKNNLLRLENIARVRGFAVGKFRPYPMSIKIVNDWIDDLKTSDVILVPISNLFDAKKEAIAKKNKKITSEEVITANESASIQQAVNKEDVVNTRANKSDDTNKVVSKVKIYSKDEYKKHYSNPQNIVFSKESPDELSSKPKSAEDGKEKESEKNAKTENATSSSHE